MSKKERIRREYARLCELFRALPPNELEFIDPLLQQAAFLCETMADMAAEINANGTTDEYQNGANQCGTKVSATIQAYNQTAKIYHNLMIKLRDRLPKEARIGALEAMMADE